MSSEPLVSIIIPIYNAETTIAKALESLIKQESANLEILLINDCSTDLSIQTILLHQSALEKKGFSIKIINHVQNMGVACARNTGLDHAKGEFIYFVDADDYIEKDTVSLLVQLATSTQAEIVGCNWYLTFEQNERKMNQPSFHDPKDALQKICSGRMRWNLWLFMVRRSLYERNQIRFIPKMNMGEDMMVMVKLFVNASQVAFLDRPLYHYNQTNDKSITKVYAETHVREVTANLEELQAYLGHQEFSIVSADHIDFLKLNIKLPLLISDQVQQYWRWLSWFPESNIKVMENRAQPLRTRLLQWLAVKKQFWAILLYNKIVVQFIYGRIYK